jgi:hypothetical protein
MGSAGWSRRELKALRVRARGAVDGGEGDGRSRRRDIL